MEKNLIHIIDNVKNDQYIYSNELNLDLKDVVSDFVKDLESSEYELDIDLSDNKCEIFIKEEIVQAGWVWNSKNTNKKVLYKLSSIPVFKIHTIKTQTQTTQTQTTHTEESETQFDLTNQAFVEKDINLLCDFFDFKSPFNAGTGYSKNPFDPINTLPININTRTAPINICNPFETKNALSLKNIWAVSEDFPITTQPNFINPFSNPNNELNSEIKRRLALPKFGLKNFKQD